jgi:hypothetical protein
VKFLADECVDRQIVDRLRHDGQLHLIGTVEVVRCLSDYGITAGAGRDVCEGSPDVVGDTRVPCEGWVRKGVVRGETRKCTYASNEE